MDLIIHKNFSLKPLAQAVSVMTSKVEVLGLVTFKKLGKFKTALGLTLALTVSGNALAANFVEEVMDDVLGGMANVTAPNAYSAANRGVISGGGIFIRNKIFDPQIVTFVPPYFRAGCGGIDMFGGSFSFINSDQLIQLFRAIAANAQGFLFQVALGVVSEFLSTYLQKFQDIIRDLNNMLKNSCEIAEGIVTNSMSAINRALNSDAASENMSQDRGDAFQSYNHNVSGSNSSTPVDLAVQSDPEGASDRNLYGNLVWKAILKNNLTNQYFSRGDDLSETLMSVTGSVIIDKPESETTTSADGSGQNKVDGASNLRFLIPRITLKEFVYGTDEGTNGTKQRYKCDTDTADGCLNPQDTSFNFVGYRRRLYQQLCGTDDLSHQCDGGLVRVLSTNNEGNGNALTDSEQRTLVSFPYEIGALLTDLASIGGGANVNNPTAYAGTFVRENIGAIALISAQYSIDQIFASVLEVLSTQKGSNAQKAIEAVVKARDQVYQEYDVLEGELGTMQEVRKNMIDLINLHGKTPQSVFSLLNNSKLINPTN